MITRLSYNIEHLVYYCTYNVLKRLINFIAKLDILNINPIGVQEFQFEPRVGEERVDLSIGAIEGIFMTIMGDMSETMSLN